MVPPFVTHTVCTVPTCRHAVHSPQSRVPRNDSRNVTRTQRSQDTDVTSQTSAISVNSRAINCKREHGIKDHLFIINAMIVKLYPLDKSQNNLVFITSTYIDMFMYLPLPWTSKCAPRERKIADSIPDRVKPDDN